jgi:HK97 family phage major capsid protein
MDLTDIVGAIEQSNAAFSQFKTKYDKRFDTLEAKLLNRPRNGGLESRGLVEPDDYDGDIWGQQRIPPEVKTLAHSIGIRPSALATALDTPEVKAFNRYMRTGQMEQKDMSAGSGSDGGYAVPKVIDSLIESVLLKQSPIRRYASVQQISTMDFHKLVNKRGFAAAWVSETQARPNTATGQLVDLVPPMGELYSNPQATQQMIDDVFFSAATWLVDELGVAFAEAEGNVFCNGNSINQPQGLLTTPVAATADATRPWGTLQYIPTTAATGFAAVSATVSPFDVLQQAIFAMRPGYRTDAAFFMHPTTLGTLAQVKDTIGRPIMVPSQVLGQPPTILGYPAVECEHFPALGANALAVAFANLRRGYLIVDRIGTRVLQDPFSNKPYISFYTTKREGGAIMNYECIKLIKCATS